jgi:hypothetical protein
LAGSKVRSFVWVDSASRTAAYFLNGKAFRNEDDVPLTGFVQVLAEGSLPLIKKTYLDIKKADYNIALNVGSPDDKILKKSKFYVLKQDRLVEIPSSRKKFLDLFNEDANLEEFIKNNNLTTSKEEHLKRIFEHYNSVQNN